MQAPAIVTIATLKSVHIHSIGYRRVDREGGRVRTIEKKAEMMTHDMLGKS